MKCDEIGILLESDARIGAEENALREHLKSCAECSAQAASMREQDAVFSRALKARAVNEVAFEKLKQRVAAEIGGGQKLPARRPFVIYAAGIAAMLALGIGVYFATRPETGARVARPDAGKAGDVFAQVAELQTKVRTSQVLDELEQLQVALDAPDDAEGKSAAEDAELYIERILSLGGRNEQAFRETLLGVNRSGISARLKKLRDSMTAETPAPVIQSLKLAIATLDEAAQIAQVAFVTPHSKEVASAY